MWFMFVHGEEYGSNPYVCVWVPRMRNEGCWWIHSWQEECSDGDRNDVVRVAQMGPFPVVVRVGNPEGSRCPPVPVG